MSHDVSALRKFVSPEIVFGAGWRRSLASFASNLGARHVLLVSAPNLRFKFSIISKAVVTDVSLINWK